MKCLERKIIPHAHIQHLEEQVHLFSNACQSKPYHHISRRKQLRHLRSCRNPNPKLAVRQRKVPLSKHSLRGSPIPAPGLSKTRHGGPLTWNSHEHHPHLCTRERILRAQLELRVLTQKGTTPAPAKQSNWSCHVNMKRYKSELSPMANLKKKSTNFPSFIQNQNQVRIHLHVQNLITWLYTRKNSYLTILFSHGISLKVLQYSVQ